MALPKKIKKDLSLEPVEVGYERRLELFNKISDKGTYLPKSLLHADLDRGFLDFVKNQLKTSVDGKTIPVVDILISTQNWSQFAQTWNFSNLDKNVEPPVITTVRIPEVKFGTLPSLKYNIPNRRQYYYAAVPTFNNGRKGMDIYTIPQPVPVDIKYSVKIICNRMRELNKFNQTIIEQFASRQSYTIINGHYIPIVMDDIADESVFDMEKRKYYIQTYNFTLQGFLIDEDEFEVKPAINRALLVTEITNKKVKSKKGKSTLNNSDILEVGFNFPNGISTYTYTFDYTNNLSNVSISNISSYDVFVNDLYFGTNIFNNENSKLQINSGDFVRIEVVKNDNNLESNINLKSIII